jgi:hypothetical protein
MIHKIIIALSFLSLTQPLIYAEDDLVPPQPGEDRWSFIQDLKAPMWTRHAWKKEPPEAPHVDLSGGVHLQTSFADPKSRLETAYQDLREFFAAGNVQIQDGGYLIETAAAPDLAAESFRIEAGLKACRILASDTEGIRRGIFELEDMLLRSRGPYLSLGTLERAPFIRRRISRCFFGPVKRPPKMRDELMDDVDYYPEQYLNRLAHEGVNGLWLTIEFRDLVSTSLTPQDGKDSERRLAKLKRTVDACLRYGIQIYVFSIEPRAWDENSPVLKAHPELAGARMGGRRCFCPWSDAAQRYIYESVNTIFKSVPELGGLINISQGERPTTCLSTLSPIENGRVDCPQCSKKAPWEILHASLSAMERGMHDAAPNAELISWLYMPQAMGQRRNDLADWVYEIPSHTPKGVILQFNFESGVRRTDFGRELVGGDYWISNPGPSPRFDRIATLAKAAGTKVSSKIQTACSHEVATAPEVPVPSLLYRKFAEMRRLGVSHSMLCWYFGNYPGLMNKAAGQLSTEPFPKDEEVFLRSLAAIDWGEKQAPTVVRAWKKFSEGYENFPLTVLFQYYGPMHDGPVWPLHLKPQDAPLSPTWLLASKETRIPFPPSGDRIGECILNAYTLDEVVELTRSMSESWNQGIEILRTLEPNVQNEPSRLLEIGVARALGIQFRSGHNILRFYQLREKLLRMEGKERLQLLGSLVAIIQEELKLNEQLLDLCQRDSRLGFHSEAEGYKYYPEKIQWRMRQLRNVLANDVPAFEQAIRDDKLLFPEYTGRNPKGAVARAVVGGAAIWSNAELAPLPNLNWQKLGSQMRWSASYDADALIVLISGPANTEPPYQVLVKVEPRRLWPSKHFLFVPRGENLAELPDNVATQSVEGRIVKTESGWSTAVRIPFARIGREYTPLSPLRMDIQVRKKNGDESWQTSHPIGHRLNLGTDNPADLGWLMFELKP